jgi:Ca2+-binding EF-hand superfamily protein
MRKDGLLLGFLKFLAIIVLGLIVCYFLHTLYKKFSDANQKSGISRIASTYDENNDGRIAGTEIENYFASCEDNTKDILSRVTDDQVAAFSSKQQWTWADLKPTMPELSLQQILPQQVSDFFGSDNETTKQAEKQHQLFIKLDSNKDSVLTMQELLFFYNGLAFTPTDAPCLQAHQKLATASTTK